MSREPMIITTILGSCISVCLWDRKRGIGGINHYMLPHWNGLGLASPKYGNIAMEKLILKMLGAGSDKKDLVAKVFGGGEVLQNKGNIFNIGQRNIEFAEDSIRMEGIPITGQSTGGTAGRKIIFNTATGEIRMKYVGKG